jgi:hypothetical protein
MKGELLPAPAPWARTIFGLFSPPFQSIDGISMGAGLGLFMWNPAEFDKIFVKGSLT